MSLLTHPAVPSAHSDHGFDALLGPARDRYLGEGHRRVGLSLGGVTQTSDHSFASAARLNYPIDWSTKAGSSRTAHLSTVDAMRIAGRLRDTLARVIPALSRYSAEQSLTVRAGARPWEALDDVPVVTEVLQLAGNDRLRLQHTIGSLKVVSDWEVPVREQPVSDEWKAGRVTNVQLTANDRVECGYERAGARPAPMSFLEAMMLTAQMAQVALYSGNAARREASGNMWMRRANFVRRRRTLEQTQEIIAQLENRRDLSVGGRQIGTAEVRADDVFGIQVTASLASGS